MTDTKVLTKLNAPYKPINEINGIAEINENKPVRIKAPTNPTGAK